MRKFTVLLLAVLLASTVFGQRKTANDLKMKHSAFMRLKADVEQKTQNTGQAKQPDVRKILASREFSRLLQTHSLMYFDGQFDTNNRVSYFYDGFSHLPSYSTEDFYFEGTFNPSGKVYFYYDSQERDTMWVSQYWEGFRNWTNSMREIWRYDQMDNQQLYLNEFWDVTNEQWFLQFATRSFYEYNDLGQVVSITYADYYMDQWFPWGRVFNEYDSAGRHIATTGQDWEDVDGKWINSWREEYDLNAQNEWLLVNYYVWEDFSQQWELDSRAIDITWLDFSELKWLTVTLQLWNGQEWENEAKGFCEYNSLEMLLTSTFQAWDGAGWMNDYRERYDYDAYGFGILEVTEYWENEAWVVNYGERYTVDYDVNANPVSIVMEYFDPWLNDWLIQGKVLLAWEVVTKVPQNNTLEFNIFPNPTQNYLKIAGINGSPEFAIFDLSARKLLSGTPTSGIIDVQALPSGTYFLQLKQNGQIATRKFIKN